MSAEDRQALVGRLWNEAQDRVAKAVKSGAEIASADLDIIIVCHEAMMARDEFFRPYFEIAEQRA